MAAHVDAPVAAKELPLLERLGSRYMRSGTFDVGAAEDLIA
jgi:hypothetical protein